MAGGDVKTGMVCREVYVYSEELSNMEGQAKMYRIDVELKR